MKHQNRQKLDILKTCKNWIRRYQTRKLLAEFNLSELKDWTVQGRCLSGSPQTVLEKISSWVNCPKKHQDFRLFQKIKCYGPRQHLWIKRPKGTLSLLVRALPDYPQL